MERPDPNLSQAYPAEPRIHRLRVVGRWEAASFLSLLLIAMPLKYGLDWPHAVMVIGWIHGVLFLLYCGVLAWAAPRLGMGLTVLAFVAALLPAGPIVLDRYILPRELR